MTATAQPLVSLRSHASRAPWSLGELASLADRLLAAAGRAPDRPTSERTVRFYVSRAVVQGPFGRGPGSAWGYPHLVELLAARLAQQAGESLDTIALRRGALAPDALESWTADALGAPLPPPLEPVQEGHDPVLDEWARVVLVPGAELHLAQSHPLRRDPARLGLLLDQLRHALSPSPEDG